MKKVLFYFIVISLLQTSLFAQVNLPLGLKAYYPFTGNANDVSGNNNNPVFNNATLVADRFGNPNSAYRFNGTSSYMRIPNSPTINMTNQMSISVWVRPTGFYSGVCHGNSIVMKGDGDFLPGNYMLRFDDNAFTNGANCSGTPVNTTNQNYYGVNAVVPSPGYTPYIQQGQWSSVIYTTDGITAKLYVDCILKYSGPHGTNTFTNTYDLFFGRLNSSQFPYWLNGDLDEVRIYDRALNQDEVNVLGGCAATTVPCNNWLRIPNYNTTDYVSIGDLDITGNTLTVEAIYSADTNYFLPTTFSYDLVSKHNNTSDCNYLLRPVSAEITTTSGFFQAITCDYIPKKINHAALVYDGVTLKFYRNGFLMSSVPASGNLVTNNLITKIGNYAAGSVPGALKGYMNEVRIWNVARTQAQIQANMFTSLLNPTTQPGLLAYYTFDNLLNKQGNTAYNGTLNGAATINNTVPNCNYVADSCVIPVSCNTWLKTTTASSFVEVGDLDVAGNKITVEATFNRSTPPVANSYGFLVSKHTNSSDLNYALWPNGCSVTTTTGQKFATENCGIELNKTYHVAMVYDGVTLKFYRNGFLHSQTPTTGNLVLNNLLTRINNDALVGSFPFNGYTNEVRIWNVARTQSEIRTYMNTSLPNPTTQSGLLGYYTFDNLLNKQGNTAYNGTLNGAATINNTVPNCNYVADSCNIIPTVGISNIINDYTAVSALDKCKNILTVADASKFNIGDTVLLIQMKGAVIDSSNTASFGTITDYKNAGNYEFNYIKAKSGNNIELKNYILRGYDLPNGKVQLVRVPYYQNVTVTGTLTAKAWDGNTGGVLAFNVGETLNLNADIDVSGKGFKGGNDPNTSPSAYFCGENQFFYPLNSDLASGKGEGIADISQTKAFGKGALGNGGGGGSSHNAGGGGGSNSANGGFGGYELEGSPCTGSTIDNRGLGGKFLNYNNITNKVFLGGGGGAGHSNSGIFQALGGNGSGIIIFTANNLLSNGYKIIANGATGISCGNSSADCHEGMGGGGGGGTILLSINTYSDNIICETKGGNGANMLASGFTRVGPGGGGGGGVLWLKQNSIPGNITSINNGGLSGVCTAYSNSPWGATSGQSGQNLFNLNLPIATVLFKPNIDSVRISNTSTCNLFNFQGQAFTNTVGIQTWQWFFGDGGTANTQNTSHTYAAANTTYTVKLVVTDLNGCKDSISKNITTPPAFIADAGNDTSLCIAPSVTVQLNASAGGTTYSWTPAGVLNNPNIRNPIATISATTTFYVTVTNAVGCSSTDSVKIILASVINPTLSISTTTSSICKGNAATFLANYTNGGSNPIFEWYKNGILVGTNSSTYTDNALNDGDVIKCKLTSNISCAAPNNVESNTITMVVVNPTSNIRYPTLNTLQNQNLQLQARTFIGASYAWNPTIGLNNNLISNPVFNHNQSREYLIRITNPVGCITIDTQLVVITGKKGLYVPKAFSPNNSGANDRLYPILVGIKQLLYFKVYNRWGILVFETNSGNPALGWNGTYKGQPQPVETYTWIAEAIDIDNLPIKKSGSTLLIR